jgi:energy-coupling factor transporter transmembrane protein EcfT
VPTTYHPHTGFHYLKLLILMIMVALVIFHIWIWVGVGIGKFLYDFGFRNFFNTKITWSGSMLVPGWLSVLLHYNNGLNVVMDC